MENNTEKVDYTKILFILTSIEDENRGDLNGRLRQILRKSFIFLPKFLKNYVYASEKDLKELPEIRCKYLYVLGNVLKATGKLYSDYDESYFNVSFLRAIKIAVEFIVYLGIFPCLLKGVGMQKPKFFIKPGEITAENLTDLQKYERLSFSVNILMEIIENPTLRPTVLSEISLLLAGLLQLSFVPLSKPTLNPPSEGFHMTYDLHEKLTREQLEFRGKLKNLMENSPQSMITRELMVILAMIDRNSPKWLRNKISQLLDERIMQRNGIVTLIDVTRDDFKDSGKYWQNLNILAKLIVTPRGKNTEIYYDAVCPQIINLLSWKFVKRGSEIANYCIVTLYECNRDICVEKIIQKIAEPLLKKENILASEDQVTECLKNLSKVFASTERKFKQLPCCLLKEISVPLFSLYLSMRNSIYYMKTNLKNLLLRILENPARETMVQDKEIDLSREKLFSAFLTHDSKLNFGRFLMTRFSGDGGVEIIGFEDSLDPEELADGLFDLISNHKTLPNDLFTYLLKYLSKNRREKDQTNDLTTIEDNFAEVMERLAVVKLLSKLANVSVVRCAQTKNPTELFGFVKSLFENFSSTKGEEDDTEILYTSLMLVKTIINDTKDLESMESFEDFTKYLKSNRDKSSLSLQLRNLIDQILEDMENCGKNERKCYDDFSVDRKRSDEFTTAMNEVSDLLIPVRAHALMTLAKFIEMKDPRAVARKKLFFALFQETLKHADSFLYLTAINGISALATSFPDTIVPLLAEEFTKDLPEDNFLENRAETRMKLAEVLVKTTRKLGEMAVKHKNLLINSFLHVIRDSDPLIRSSSLSCLGELCKVLGFRLGNVLIEIFDCIAGIIEFDKSPECRRAAVLLATLLLRGLGKQSLTEQAKDLLSLYRVLKNLRDNDRDDVVQLHAQLALEEIDDIVKEFLIVPAKLEKKILLLP